jgi:hypothetical protein
MDHPLCKNGFRSFLWITTLSEPANQNHVESVHRLPTNRQDDWRRLAYSVSVLRQPVQQLVSSRGEQPSRRGNAAGVKGSTLRWSRGRRRCHNRLTLLRTLSAIVEGPDSQAGLSCLFRFHRGTRHGYSELPNMSSTKGRLISVHPMQMVSNNDS